MKRKTAVITGGTGFIGTHLCKRLKKEGYWVRVVDLKEPEFEPSEADEVVILDLSDSPIKTQNVFIDPFKSGKLNEIGVDEVYALACLMGGAGFIFTGENDADILTKSSLCNINTVKACHELGVNKVFYSSSACCYNHLLQLDPNNPGLTEDMAWPAYPDSAYGKEKLFAEDLYLAYNRNYGLDVRIARFHNIFGPLGTWQGGKEKAPAAICRKVIAAKDEIEIWGDGEQTRSFLYIDECIEGIRRLMNGDFIGPVNLGSEEMVTINQLVDIACAVEGKTLKKVHILGPTGVRGRNSDNKLIKEKLGWEPNYPLASGIEKTYYWIKSQMEIK
jgi:GDP-D-mannose 3',5'-epimerase